MTSGVAQGVAQGHFCAKCFVLFVLGREGGGVRDNYTR